LREVMVGYSNRPINVIKNIEVGRIDAHVGDVDAESESKMDDLLKHLEGLV